MFRLLHTDARALIAASVLIAGTSAAPVAQAAITFDFQYASSTTDAFNDATYGAQRRAALEQAGSLFSSMFGSHFTNSGTITLAVTGLDSLSSTALASAGSSLWLQNWPAAGFNMADVVGYKLRTGEDLNKTDADGTIKFNFAYQWQLDPGASVGSGQYDFYSTAFHELTHTLGFSSKIRADGSDLMTGYSPDQYWGVYDSFLTDKNGNRIINPTTFLLDSSVWTAASVGGVDNGVFFSGANAVAANGGQAVALYSPTTWSGSSLSHLDENAVYRDLLMSYSAGRGSAPRDYSAVEVGILTDLGYTPTAVPEPEQAAMLLAGLGVIAWLRRRRTAAPRDTSQRVARLQVTAGGGARCPACRA